MKENEDKLKRLSQGSEVPKRSDISIIEEYLSIEHLLKSNKESSPTKKDIYDNCPFCKRGELKNILHLEEALAKDFCSMKKEIHDLKERLAILEAKFLATEKLQSTSEINENQNITQDTRKTQEREKEREPCLPRKEVESKEPHTEALNTQNNENTITTEKKESQNVNTNSKSYSFPETSIILKKLKQKYRWKKFLVKESMLTCFSAMNRPPLPLWRSFLNDLVQSSDLSSTTKQNKNKTVSTFYFF